MQTLQSEHGRIHCVRDVLVQQIDHKRDFGTDTTYYVSRIGLYSKADGVRLKMVCDSIYSFS